MGDYNLNQVNNHKLVYNVYQWILNFENSIYDMKWQRLLNQIWSVAGDNLIGIKLRLGLDSNSSALPPSNHNYILDQQDVPSKRISGSSCLHLALYVTTQLISEFYFSKLCVRSTPSRVPRCSENFFQNQLGSHISEEKNFWSLLGSPLLREKYLKIVCLSWRNKILKTMASRLEKILEVWCVSVMRKKIPEGL